KWVEGSRGNAGLGWIADEPERVANRQQERDPQCRAASQRKKIEGKRSSLLRGLQLEDGLATRSAQDAAKRFGCCHHGAILRVGGGRNLGDRYCERAVADIRDLVAALAQNGDGLRADQACAADDDDLHGFPSLSDNWRPLNGFDESETTARAQ